jgi:hypothetical protein
LGSTSGGNSTADFQVYYRTFDDYVTQSVAVFEGEVLSEARGAVTGNGEYREQVRVLQIKIRHVLSGVRPNAEVLRFDDFGWRQVEGRPEELERPEGYLRVEPGDVGIFAVRTSDNRIFGFVNDQAVFLLHGNDVRDTDRRDPFVREGEGLSADELRAGIREAAPRLGRSPF